MLGSDGFVMLMSPNKDETAVSCLGDMAVCMYKVLGRLGGWCLSVSLAFFVCMTIVCGYQGLETCSAQSRWV